MVTEIKRVKYISKCFWKTLTIEIKALTPNYGQSKSKVSKYAYYMVEINRRRFLQVSAAAAVAVPFVALGIREASKKADPEVLAACAIIDQEFDSIFQKLTQEDIIFRMSGEAFPIQYFNSGEVFKTSIGLWNTEKGKTISIRDGAVLNWYSLKRDSVKNTQFKTEYQLDILPERDINTRNLSAEEIIALKDSLSIAFQNRKP